mmetsp:Transcript_19823/g.14582  ORF Transcript_19823/g.14582 Transcript_19823/m.14582 type:complete len:80 (+) Transcript_19823:447-686(+)
MRYKQVLIIREVGIEQQAQIIFEAEHQVTTWCCCNGGRSKSKVEFSKNHFEPHEKCTAKVYVDNKRSNKGLQGVRMALE